MATKFAGSKEEFRLTPGRPRGARSKEEESHCIGFMQSMEMSCGALPELRLMYHIPNGGSRHIAEAVKLKRMGVKRGVADYHLPVPRSGYASLYIEFKSAKGKLSPEQDAFAEAVTKEGNLYVIARDWLSARDVVLAYLKDCLTSKHLSDSE